MTWIFLGAICVAIYGAMRLVHRSQASWLNDADDWSPWSSGHDDIGD